MRTLKELHQQIQIEVKTIQTHEKSLLDLLEELDQRKGYYDLGFSSLYEYCTKGLGLTEGQACAFIAVERMAVKVPALKSALQCGKLSLSKAKRIQDRRALKLAQEGRVQDKRAQDRRALKLVQDKRAQESPVQEDRVDQDQDQGQDQDRVPFPHKPTALIRNARVRLPAHLKEQIELRDDGHCQHRSPDGSLCKQRRYLHVHHLKPIAQGGTNGLENLTLRCQSHHFLHHYTEQSQWRRGRGLPGMF